MSKKKMPADSHSGTEELAAEAPVEETGAKVEVGTEDPALLLEDARAKADEHWNQVLRIQAELENTRRRAQADVEKAHKYGLEKFAQELLPVKDSLEMGLAAAEGSDHEIAAKLREGTELTLKMLIGVLEKFGVKEVNPLGQSFNPELHQAMSMQPSEEHAPNTVTLVMQKGYTLNDRLIRPAMVMVSK
ncbi:MAG: nucleotide exchange factor GrpE [Gammaproteobacteria bacterium]|nr:nucleotide exchange factor GrpE [Gammaproteobacteria bacterium]